jgi:hypothetical protein
MTEQENPQDYTQEVFEQASHHFNQVLAKVDAAFRDTWFSVYDVQQAFNAPHQDSKMIIETLLGAGMLVKDPKKMRYQVSIYNLVDFKKVLDHIIYMKSVHSTNMLFCDVALDFMQSITEEALNELESKKQNQEDGQEETSKES